MAIKIIEEPDVYLTKDELERLRQEYNQSCMMMVNPPSFERFVRQRKALK